MDALNQHIEERVHHSLSMHVNTLSKSEYALPEFPTLTLDQRGLVAGTALLNKNHIRLNRSLLEHHLPYFLEQVIPHELAHLAVFNHFGRVRPHGKEWQMVMKDIFSLPPERCHNLPTSHAKVRMYLYECECQQVQIGVRRHNKISRGQATYACRKCKTEIKFVRAL